MIQDDLLEFYTLWLYFSQQEGGMSFKNTYHKLHIKLYLHLIEHNLLIKALIAKEGMENESLFWPFVCPDQNLVYNWQGLVQNKNMGPLVQIFL